MAKMVPKMVWLLLAGKRKKKRAAETEMMIAKEKKKKLSAFWIMQLWKMPTIFVTLCKICFIFAGFSGKGPAGREKGRGKDARKKAKRAKSSIFFFINSFTEFIKKKLVKLPNLL